MKVSDDEGAALRACHDFSGCRIDESVGIEKELLRAQSKIIDRSQQCAIVENSRATTDDCFA